MHAYYHGVNELLDHSEIISRLCRVHFWNGDFLLKLPISNMAIVYILLAMVIDTLSQSYRSAFGIKARVAGNKLADQ